MKNNKRNKKQIKNKILIMIIYIIIILIIIYPIYKVISKINSNSSISNAKSARIYQNFVYKNSNLIPNNCIVFTFDPTLFFLNNKTAIQFTNLYNFSLVSNLSNQYSCLVVDYGYWCYTSYSNYCSNLIKYYKLNPIKTIKDSTYKFGFYYIKLKK